MTALTPAWTERHTALTAAAGLVAAAVVVSVTEPWPATPVVATAAVLVFAGALAFEAMIGIVIALVVTAGSIALKKLADIWTPDVLVPSGAEVILLMLLGLCAGSAGRMIRHEERGRAAAESDPSSVTGSMGLFSLDLGMLRLEEEIDRAVLHDRPLALLLLSFEIHLDPAWGAREREAIERTIARVVETLLRVSDVPFAVTDVKLGAVLPETGSHEAWGVVMPILDALAGASFVVRPSGERHPLAKHTDISIGLAFLGEHGVTAEELVASLMGSPPTVRPAQSDAGSGT